MNYLSTFIINATAKEKDEIIHKFKMYMNSIN